VCVCVCVCVCARARAHTRMPERVYLCVRALLDVDIFFLINTCPGHVAGVNYRWCHCVRNLFSLLFVPHQGFDSVTLPLQSVSSLMLIGTFSAKRRGCLAVLCLAVAWAPVFV
jgi:hypothetical protein